MHFRSSEGEYQVRRFVDWLSKEGPEVVHGIEGLDESVHQIACPYHRPDSCVEDLYDPFLQEPSPLQRWTNRAQPGWKVLAAVYRDLSRTCHRTVDKSPITWLYRRFWRDRFGFEEYHVVGFGGFKRDGYDSGRVRDDQAEADESPTSVVGGWVSKMECLARWIDCRSPLVQEAADSVSFSRVIKRMSKRVYYHPEDDYDYASSDDDNDDNHDHDEYDDEGDTLVHESSPAEVADDSLEGSFLQTTRSPSIALPFLRGEEGKREGNKWYCCHLNGWMEPAGRFICFGVYSGLNTRV
ncbi:hypothetical protein BKA57DRAFT_455276 [Linnemannia elongata]|nr:hypothetical protein BKA57DRAFT_455276 [Linnemannia elongata]